MAIIDRTTYRANDIRGIADENSPDSSSVMSSALLRVWHTWSYCEDGVKKSLKSLGLSLVRMLEPARSE